MNDATTTPRTPRRRRTTITSALALSAIVVLAAIAIPFQAAGAATRVNLWVHGASGSDTTNCRTKTAPCATITYALTHAPSTGTNINLLADVADEVDVTTDNVTIQSSPSTSHFAIRPTTDTLAAATPAGAPVRPIVYVGPSRSGIKLTNISIDGSSRPSAGGCSAGTGHTGLYVRSAQTTLSRTDVTAISQGPGLTGCQNGLAIYVRTDASAASNVSITQGTVSDFDKNGITCNDVGTTCAINKTKVIGRGAILAGGAAQNGIQFGRGAKGSITGVEVHAHNYAPDGQATGILLYNTGSGVLVKASNVYDNNVNIYAINDGTTAGQTSANLTISTNQVHDAATSLDGNVGHGIALDSVSNAIVQTNKLEGNALVGIAGYGILNSTIKGNVADAILGSPNGDGIFLGGQGSVNASSTGNFVASNKANGNTEVGLHLDAGATSNVLSSNTMNGNAVYEAQDESTGSGTAGTGNTWSGNRCTSGNDQPNGLCR